MFATAAPHATAISRTSREEIGRWLVSLLTQSRLALACSWHIDPAQRHDLAARPIGARVELGQRRRSEQLEAVAHRVAIARVHDCRAAREPELEAPACSCAAEVAPDACGDRRVEQLADLD